jgi:hypothetical protein
MVIKARKKKRVSGKKNFQQTGFKTSGGSRQSRQIGRISAHGESNRWGSSAKFLALNSGVCIFIILSRLFAASQMGSCSSFYQT